MNLEDLTYDEWCAEWNLRVELLVFDRIDRLRDETRAHAKLMSARLRRSPTKANRARSDEAWARVRRLEGPLDALGEPVDPALAGRAKYAEAFEIATGMPYLHPVEDDCNPDHRKGRHVGMTSRYGYGGDLPPCGECMNDEYWVLTRSHTNKRKVRR